MSLFCIIGIDAQQSDVKREQLREAHMEYLRLLKKADKLFSAGPLVRVENKCYCGTVLIVEFDNQAEVEDWFAKEPFNRAGVYKKVDIYPYIDAMPYI